MCVCTSCWSKLKETPDGANDPIEMIRFTSYPEGLNARKRPWFSEQAYSPSTLQEKQTSIHQKAEERHMWNRVNLWAAVLTTNFLALPLSLTQAPVQTQGCIAWVNSPEEHRRSLHHRRTVSPSSSQRPSQLSHEEPEGETGSHYCL